jgi:hypothetical protein
MKKKVKNKYIYKPIARWIEAVFLMLLGASGGFVICEKYLNLSNDELLILSNKVIDNLWPSLFLLALLWAVIPFVFDGLIWLIDWVFKKYKKYKIVIIGKNENAK